MEPCWMNVLMEDDAALLDECVDGMMELVG